MGNKINVAEILKDKSQGTKLYDLLRNIDVELDKVHTTDVGTYIECTSTNEVGSTLLFDYSKLGTEKCWLEGLRILLPSKNMRDWGKFAWKKGDVLINSCGFQCIFKEWASDDYTKFNGCYSNSRYGYSIVSVIRQSDNVGSEKFVGEKDERSHSIPIYDGDVMLCYVNKPEFWSSDWRNSGLYICESGSYHRLLYTPNKGYVRHGEPDVDEDFTLDIEEESFSSYVITLDQSWYKLGNVYAGIGFLKEKE